MSDVVSHEDAGLSRAAKQRMERGLLSPELREFMQVSREVKKPPMRTGPFIAISRESGAGGSIIARQVGQQLDWDVLDKEILDFLVQRYNLPRDMLEFVDETKASWIHDVLGSFFDSRVVSHENYVVHLERIMFLAALHGNVVFVGRGAHCILPRDNAIAVRIIAPMEYRIEQIMTRRNLDRVGAQQLIKEIDEGRDAFNRRYFHGGMQDPHLFDMVINVERIGPELAARQIVDTYRQLSETRRGVEHD